MITLRDVATFAVGVALVCSTHAVNGAPVYHFTDLGTLDGRSQSSAFGINNLGQIVGFSNSPGQYGHAFLWENGVMTDLGGGASSAAQDINDAGQIAGYATTDQGDQQASIYSGGTITNIHVVGNLGAGNSFANGINQSGQVTGYAGTLSRPYGFAFRYGGGTMTDLGSLAGRNTAVHGGINNLGQVVGSSDVEVAPNTFREHAFLYDNGMMNDLGTLGGYSSRATDINDIGQIVGYADLPDGMSTNGFLYQGGVMTDLGKLSPLHVNNQGQIVGQIPTVDGGRHAAIHENGTSLDLNDLLDTSGAGWNLTYAQSINEFGWIVGGASYAGGPEHGYLLTPVPSATAWGVDANGNWSLAANWTLSAPNAIGATAIMGSVISVPRTVVADMPQTVGKIVFDSANSYTIAGPGALTLTNFGGAIIETASGSHTISAPISIAALNSLTKTGPGTLTLAGKVTCAPNTTFTIAEGVLNLNVDAGPNLLLMANATTNLGATQHLGQLAISGAVEVNLALGSKLIRTTNLSLSSGAKLDLADGKLILDGSADSRLARLLQTRAAVADGAAGLTWSGPGIASSAAGVADERTALGVMLNDDGQGGAFYDTFAGEPVDANAVLVRYTYYGDADLSGYVDGTDYALIDHGFNAGRTGWFNGDFDYSGHVDGTDYALIDNAFNSQGGPLGLGNVVAVPEPSALVLGAMSALVLSLLAGRRSLRQQLA